MRTEAEIMADAADGAPFSNATSFEVWAFNNCGRSSGCVHDDAWGSGDEGANCPLITVSMLQKTPQEWLEDGEIVQCSAFEEVVAHATDDEPADENPDAGYDDPWRPVETIKGQEGMF